MDIYKNANRQIAANKEELANTITHGIGLILSLAALVVLLAYAGVQGDAWKIISFGIYGASLVLLYTASTLYHSVNAPKIKHYLKIFDHAAIYWLIAGTYTPFLLVLLRENYGWTLFGVIWGLALIGTIFKLFFVNRFNLFSTIIYLVMGWVLIIAFHPLLGYIPEGGLYLIFSGGFCYSLGVIFYLWQKIPYHHAIWHIFVLAGSICHFFAVLLYVLPS